MRLLTFALGAWFGSFTTLTSLDVGGLWPMWGVLGLIIIGLEIALR